MVLRLARCCRCRGVVLAAAGSGQEVEMPLDEVPRAVLDAVQGRFDGATLVGAARQREGGALV